MGQMAERMRLGLALCVVLVGLGACSSIYRNHGYVPADDELSALTVGVDTRDTVASAVGRPTSVGVLDDGGWYYVKSRFRNFAYRAPEEVEREVLAISFDQAGVLENIERFGLQDGKAVVLSRRVTDSNIKGVGFLRQLLGNLGVLDAESLVN